MIELQGKEAYVDFTQQEGKNAIEIYSPQCGPCKVLKQQVLPEVENEVHVATVDGTKYFDVLDEVKKDSGEIVTGVPVLMLYSNGSFVKRINGLTDKENILNSF